MLTDAVVCVVGKIDALIVVRIVGVDVNCVVGSTLSLTAVELVLVSGIAEEVVLLSDTTIGEASTYGT